MLFISIQKRDRHPSTYLLSQYRIRVLSRGVWIYREQWFCVQTAAQYVYTHKVLQVGDTDLRRRPPTYWCCEHGPYIDFMRSFLDNTGSEFGLVFKTLVAHIDIIFQCIRELSPMEKVRLLGILVVWEPSVKQIMGEIPACKYLFSIR